MQVTVENTTGLKHRLTVELPKEELNRKIEERLSGLKNQASIEGFRPGKAPLDVVRSKFGPRVEEEVFSEAVKQSLQHALEREQLEPVAEPVVELDDAPEATFLRYHATFEVMPRLDIQPIENIKLERPVVEVAAADVDSLIENLRTQRTQWKPSGGAARAGDRVTLDYNGTVNGQGFPGSVAQGMSVVIGEGSLLPGLEEQLVGMVAGGVTDIQAKIPETFPVAEFRGKTANFSVRILQVEAPELPDLDEKFFRSFGVHEGGLQVFRDMVKHTMEFELKQKVVSTLKTRLLDQLLAMHDVPVPETLLKLEIERMKSLEGQEQTEALSDEAMEKQAKYRVAGGIVFTCVARNLGISPTSEKVREKIESLAEGYENPDEVVAWYYSSQEQLAKAEAMVSEELLLEYVLEHGQVTDQPMSFKEMMNG